MCVGSGEEETLPSQHLLLGPRESHRLIAGKLTLGRRIPQPARPLLMFFVGKILVTSSLLTAQSTRSKEGGFCLHYSLTMASEEGEEKEKPVGHCVHHKMLD